MNPQKSRINTEEKLQIISRILAEKKAEDVDVIDLRGRTLIADYFVICSGTSTTHIKAIVEGLIQDAKAEGLHKQRAEGENQARWVLVDYEDVVVHVFAPEEREYYDIESLWKETALKLEGG
jgi:ribosome-associated protein